jgi:very-short-patch-repair endonuclease
VSSTLNLAELREAIAETVATQVSADDVPHACDVLCMPTGPEGGNPWSGKRRYVRNRLLALTEEELVETVRNTARQYGDPGLMRKVGPAGVLGVDGEMKNLIFAANGPKPRIILRDAINNVIEIVEHADKCLVYDQPLDATGLSWGTLTAWWAQATDAVAGADPARALFARLRQSLDSEAEKVFFNAYGALYGATEGSELPALLPQVYLHYDPYTLRELKGRVGQPLKRQRMDFLLLLPDRSRVVIEVDGKQHYAEDDVASPRRYAEMVAEDRRLRLAGYEVYRFGGAELHPQDPAAPQRARSFIDALLQRHGAHA